MNPNKLIIGIGGLARSGKDTMCEFLIDYFTMRGLKSKRMALADELKRSIRSRLIDEYKIDISNCTPQEKERIRPELVAFGKKLRENSRGTHWTKIVEEKMKLEDFDIVIVPDIRYHVYPEDEVSWVKNQGLLIHVARYDIKDGQKIWLTPPNEDETKNDPLVRAAADFSISWETKPKEQLFSEFTGFAQMVAIVANNELSRTKRRAVNKQD